jgi:hypothetical protein
MAAMMPGTPEENDPGCSQSQGSGGRDMEFLSVEEGMVK